MENAKERKRPLLNLLGRVFGNPLVRGPLKSLPFGSLGYEIADTVKWFRERKKLRSQGKEVPEMPHSPVSMAVQLLFVVGILYGIFTKQINPDVLLQYFTPDDFKDFGGSVLTANPVDSL